MSASAPGVKISALLLQHTDLHPDVIEILSKLKFEVTGGEDDENDEGEQSTTINYTPIDEDDTIEVGYNHERQVPHEIDTDRRAVS